MRIIITLLYLVYALPMFSQGSINFSDYHSLQCQGEMPSEFKDDLNTWMAKIDLGEAPANEKEKARQAKYRELVSYQILNRFYSGNLLYGDVLTQYVNKVADLALIDVPALRKRLSFYVVKSTDFNAYTTPSGVIFVSVGLLARIETEAQLAYIICHEAAHYDLNHNYKSYVYRNSFGVGKKAPDAKVLRKKILEKSKEHELEADTKGLKYFLKSAYSHMQVESMFGIMLYSYLPFKELVFDTAYFNSGNFVIPHKYFPDKVAGISAEEDVPDSMRTHPNILKRRSAVKLILEKEGDTTGKSFIQTQELFEYCRKVARYEMAHIYMAEAEYEEAIYAAYLLEKLYEKSLYTDKIVAGALYLIAKHKNHKTEQSRTPYNRAGSKKQINVANAYWESIEGESQSVYFFASQMAPKEMNILAARHIYSLWKKYGDLYFLKRSEDLLKEMQTKYLMNVYDFYPSEMDAIKIGLDESKTVGKEYIQKIESANSRIEKNSERFNYNKKSFFLYAFQDFYTDKEFSWLFNKDYFAIRYIDATENMKELFESNIEKPKNIIMFSPDCNVYNRKYISGRYTVYSYRSSDPEFTPTMELEYRTVLRGNFNKHASTYSLSLQMFGFGLHTTMNTEEFNKYQQLLTWYNEKSQSGEHSLYVYNDENIEMYKTQYGYLAYSVMNTIDDELEFVYILYDLHTGKIIVLDNDGVSKGKIVSSKADKMIKKAMQLTADALKL